MAPNSAIMQAVEQLDYRATVGDVASRVGLDVKQAQQGLFALASDAGGHLQVAETGDIVYQFPKNFRAILRNKFLRLRLQEWWEKVWRVLFYLIRISFGILLIVSIVLIFVTISILLLYFRSSRDSDGDGGGGGDSGGGFFFFPYFWFGDIFWWFDPGYDSTRQRQRQKQRKRSRQGRESDLNFLEAVFSFLFGDGNPNANLEERRWKQIATVIRNNNGAVVAEQIAPYLDDLGEGYDRDYEDYMLPVLSRFNGQPEVSPEGQIVYHFPELQVTAGQGRSQPVSAYLQEAPWRFSQAGSGQLILAAGLGALNFVGALILGSLLSDGTIAAEIGGLVAFVQSIYWLLLGYGTAFLGIPLIRYFWIQQKNGKIEQRNQQRQERTQVLAQPSDKLQKKLAYADRFAKQTAIGSDDLAYTTEKDLNEQELEQSDKIDEEWRRRLESGSS